MAPRAPGEMAFDARTLDPVGERSGRYFAAGGSSGVARWGVGLYNLFFAGSGKHGPVGKIHRSHTRVDL